MLHRKTRRIALLACLLMAASCAKQKEAAAPTPSSTTKSRTELEPNPSTETDDASEPASVSSGRTDMAFASVAPPSWDPHGVRESVGAQVVIDLFCGLTTRDAGGKPIPGLAESWVTSDDKLTWTFTLRKGLQWSDGTPLDASGLVWSWRRALHPETKNIQVGLLYPIAGAEAFSKGEQTDPATLGVSAPDPHTLMVRLERPYPRLLELMATAYAAPAPKHVVEKHPRTWTQPEHIVSNGAYVLSEYVHGEKMIFEDNALFHAADSVALTKITMYIATDSAAAYQWYETKKIDWTGTLVPTDVIQKKMESGAADLHIHDVAAVFLLVLNTQKAPLDDVRIRRAMDLAIDRRKLAKQVLRSGQKPAKAIVPPQMTNAQPPRRARYDVAAARKLLTEAGYPGGKGCPSVELIYNTNETNKTIAAFIQRDLKESLGLPVEVRNLDWKTYLAQLGSPAFGMGQVAMGGFDALDFAQLLRGDNPDNKARWKSAEYDAAIQEAREAPTIAAQDAALAKALAVADREAPILALYTMTRSTVMRPGLAGFEETYDNFHPLRWMRWEAK